MSAVKHDPPARSRNTTCPPDTSAWTSERPADKSKAQLLTSSLPSLPISGSVHCLLGILQHSSLFFPRRPPPTRPRACGSCVCPLTSHPLGLASATPRLPCCLGAYTALQPQTPGATGPGACGHGRCRYTEICKSESDHTLASQPSPLSSEQTQQPCAACPSRLSVLFPTMAPAAWAPRGTFLFCSLLQLQCIFDIYILIK